MRRDAREVTKREKLRKGAAATAPMKGRGTKGTCP